MYCIYQHDKLKPYVQKLLYCSTVDCMLSCDRYILLCKHHVHSPFVCPQINADRGAGPAVKKKIPTRKSGQTMGIEG